MIFGLLRIGSMLGPPKFKGAIPQPQVKPTTGKGVAWVIILVSVVVIGITLAAGSVAGYMGLLTACIIGFSVLVLGSMLFRGVSGIQAQTAKLKKLTDMVPVSPTPQAERARADALERRRAELAPEPKPEPAAHVVRPAVDIRTYNEILSDRELTARMERIAALIIVTCYDCGAGEAELCTFNPDKPDAPVTLLDRERSIVVHDSRIGRSVKEQIAKITDVVAQYNDHVPDSVWRYAV